MKIIFKTAKHMLTFNVLTFHVLTQCLFIFICCFLHLLLLYGKHLFTCILFWCIEKCLLSAIFGWSRASNRWLGQPNARLYWYIGRKLQSNMHYSYVNGCNKEGWWIFTGKMCWWPQSCCNVADNVVYKVF